MADLSRRAFVKVGAAGLAGAALGSRAAAKDSARLFYVGTYTQSGKSEGIYICRFDPATGSIANVGVAKGVAEPSFLVADRRGEYLYAVNELIEYEGKPGGAVSAFRIRPEDGALTFLNRVPSLGGAPCHLSISKKGDFLLVANYVGGNVAVIRIGKDGRLGEAVDVEQHTGSGPNAERQKAPHAHSITLDPSNRFAFAADLGTDKLMNYAFDPDTGKLEPNRSQDFFSAKPGSGPRHFAFHPDGRNAYLINELNLTVTSLAFDRKTGVFNEIETVSAVAGVPQPGSSGADIHVSPDGRFLYASVRGQNLIAAFRIDQERGRLVEIANVPTGGRRPRNFAIDPSGAFLLVANQDSDSIVVFRINQKTGKPEAAGTSANIPVPVCVRFL